MRSSTFETILSGALLNNRQAVVKTASLVFLGVALYAFSVPAHANLVLNGSFETTSAGGGPGIVNNSGQVGYNINAANWTTTGYIALFAPGVADTVGTLTSGGFLQLWGPGAGAGNGLPASSPDGGNYLAADGAYQVAPLSQTINGLTAGTAYTVGFWWAGAQQSGYTGPNTEQWIVSLGSQTKSTSIANNVSQGFTGWAYQTFNFTADGASDVLSFLAAGTPAGLPPFVLLDGVSLNVASANSPEPGTYALVLLGGLGLAGLARSRLRK